jgi:hypothetical protein
VDVHGFMQWRYHFNHRSSSDTHLDANGNENAVGFQDARTALTVSGNIFSEDWYYFIRADFSDSTALGLQDAYGTYNFGNGWNLMWGQFTLPFMRESLVDNKFQLAAERSIVENTLSIGRSQGVQLGYESNNLRFMASFNDGGTNAAAGGGAQNSDFTSGGEADYAGTARVEYKWAGDWKQALDFTSFPQSPFFGMVGGAVHAQHGGDTFATTDVDVWGATADVSVEGDGWNAFASGVFIHTDPSVGNSFDDFGFTAQGGIFLGNPKWEAFARWDIVVPDSDHSPMDSNFNTLTFGVNNYMIPDSHAAKLTLEVEWFLEKTDKSIAPPNTLTGLLPSSKSGEFDIVAQMQLVF